MKKLFALAAALLTMSQGAGAADSGWIDLFDGKSLTGWKANENPETFNVKDGLRVVKGLKGHLYYIGSVKKHDFTDFEFEAEINTKPKANSGVYFHTVWQAGDWPSTGYEIQVNNSHGDPKRTAGLYAIDDNFDAPVKDGEWFTLNIKVQGKRIITKVNGKVIKDYTEPTNPPRPKGMEKRLLGHGTFAIQGHDPGSEVHYRKIRVKPLP